MGRCHFPLVAILVQAPFRALILVRLSCAYRCIVQMETLPVVAVRRGYAAGAVAFG